MGRIGYSVLQIALEVLECFKTFPNDGSAVIHALKYP